MTYKKQWFKLRWGLATLIGGILLAGGGAVWITQQPRVVETETIIEKIVEVPSADKFCPFVKCYDYKGVNMWITENSTYKWIHIATRGDLKMTLICHAFTGKLRAYFGENLFLNRPGEFKDGAFVISLESDHYLFDGEHRAFKNVNDLISKPKHMQKLFQIIDETELELAQLFSVQDTVYIR